MQQTMKHLGAVAFIIMIATTGAASGHFEPSNGDEAYIIEDTSSSGFMNSYDGSGSLDGTVTIDWNEDTEGDQWLANSDITVELWLNYLKNDCENYRVTKIGETTYDGIGADTFAENSFDISQSNSPSDIYQAESLQIIVRMDEFGGEAADGVTDAWDGPNSLKVMNYDADACDDIDADFSYSPSNPMVGDEVEFDGSDTSYNGPDNLEYDWTFGTDDGTDTGSGTSSTQTWDNDGEYTAILTVVEQSDSNNNDVTQRTIDVDAIDADIDYTPSTPVTGQDITFDASDTVYEGDGSLEYEWHFTTPNVADDPIVKYGSEVTHSWALAENQGATLHVRETDGDAVDISTATIDVQDGSPAEFDVSITGTNTPVTAGMTASITAEIENTGTVDDTQTICLDWGGTDCVDSTEVTLSGDATETITLEYDTADGETGTTTAAIRSDDGEAEQDITVEAATGPAFDVSISTTNTPRQAGNDIEAEVTVENTDTYEGDGPISLEWDGLASTSEQTVSLGSGETTTITFSTPTSNGDGGDYTIEAASNDDSDTETITVEPLEEGQFSAEIIDSNEPATQGLLAKLTVRVDNTGDLEESTTLCFDWTHKEDCQETFETTIDGGNSKEFQHSFATTEDFTGDRTVRIQTSDGTVLLTKDFTIQEQETPYPVWDVSCSASGGGVDWTCESGESGHCYPQDTMSEGTHEITVSCEDDVAGTSDTSTQTVTVDRTPPDVDIDASIPDEWTNETQTIDVDCSDAISGCDSSSFKIAMVGDNPDASDPTSCPSTEAAYTTAAEHELDDYRWVCVMAEDQAGNMATAGPFEFLVDTTVPDVALTGPTYDDHLGHVSSTDGTTLPWFNDDFNLTLTATDLGPSETSCELVIDDGGETTTRPIECTTATQEIAIPDDCATNGFGSCSFTFNAIDEAQNSDQYHRIVSIDTTAPTINCDGRCLPETVGTDVNAPVEATISDSHAGIDYANICEDSACEEILCDISDGSCTLDAVSDPMTGRHVYITAVDELENIEQREVTYSIKETFGGACITDEQCMSGECNDQQECVPTEMIPPSITFE